MSITKSTRRLLEQGYGQASVNATFPPERPTKMSFAEEVVEAIGELVDEKLTYAETRRGPGAEYANRDPVFKAEERLQGLLSKVKFAI